MKEVDNFDLIIKQLHFESKDEFYFLQIIQRKKDGNENLHSQNGYRLIKSYYIYNTADLIMLKDRIIELCQNNNARAYINLNVRNAQELALECIKKYSDLVLSDNAHMGNNIWDSCCGMYRARKYKSLWVIDVDNIGELDQIKEMISKCRGDSRIVAEIPTPNGVHLITTGFDTTQFIQHCIIKGLKRADIHKDSPTLLYYKC